MSSFVALSFVKALAASGAILIAALSPAPVLANASADVFEVNDWKDPPKNLPWSSVITIKSPFETYKAVFDQDYKGRSCFISCNFYDGFISRWTADQLSVSQFSTYCFSGNCRKNYSAIPFGIQLSVNGIQYSLSGADGLFALNAKVRKAIAALEPGQKISVRIGGSNMLIYNIGSASSSAIVSLMKSSIADDKGIAAKGLTVSSSTAIASGTLAQPVIKRAIPGVAQVETPSSKGTGFIIDKSGLMLTNRHVVGRFSEVKVKFNDGRELPASVVGRTSDLDVALLQLQGLSKNANEPSLPLCVRKPASVGEDIIVIGNPLGLQATTTRGIVSGVRSDDGSTLIQIDAPVNPGNSGGPVINYNGEVIGIVTAKQVAIGVEGIGYAIGIASALESLGVGYKDYVSGPNSAKSKLTQCNNLIR
jgi:S1-C subfamily serine protease